MPRFPASRQYLQEFPSPNPGQPPDNPPQDRKDPRLRLMSQPAGQNKDHLTRLNAFSPTHHHHHPPYHPYITASPQAHTAPPTPATNPPEWQASHQYM